MPAEAIKTGVVNEVLGLDAISAAIEKRVAKASAIGSGGNAMKIAAQEKGKIRRGAAHSEQMILFAVANRMFAIAAAAVQEIRSTDSLAVFGE